MEVSQYTQFIKPEWAPPSWLFGPVWSVLYLIIAITFGYVLYLAIKKRISAWVLLPFGINAIANIAFTPIQFGLQNNLLASIDILIVLVSIVWFMKNIYPHAKWVAFANIPYLLWVSFATVLQFTITWMNW
jgi:translocator protein